MFQILTVISFCVSVRCATFRAAVYEHAVVLPDSRDQWVDRSTALENMMKNLHTYKQQAVEAGKQDVDIIVFPEDGIYGMKYSRIGLESYLEFIPDPSENWNACDFPSRYNNTEIQYQLSCMAKNASLYLVANIGDIQLCDPSSDPKCPSDGHYQFNTDVVYNPQGDLIAKYHKINLFFESQFDPPPSKEIVTFETSFGKFAVFTCFDILFKTPAIDSIGTDVTNVVFPTAWMDALPLLAAVQYHSAFAAGMNINFLAANINRPEKRFQGSGIYTPSGFATYYYNETKGGQLLIADLKVIKSRKSAYNLNSRPTELDKFTSENNFQSYVFHDLFTFVPLSNTTGSLYVCNNQLCCYLDYALATDFNETEQYAFGAFDGLHTHEGTYYLQICTLLKCKSNDKSSCGEPVYDANTKFSEIKLYGTFGTQYIFPEVLLSHGSMLKLAANNTWSFKNGVLESKDEFSEALLSFGLFARDYGQDEVLLNVSIIASPNLQLVISLLLMLPKIQMF